MEALQTVSETTMEKHSLNTRKEAFDDYTIFVYILLAFLDSLHKLIQVYFLPGIPLLPY